MLIQEVCRKYPGSVQEVCRKCTGNVQEVSRKYQEVSRKCAGIIQEVYRKCPGSVQKVSGSVQEVSRKSQEVSRKCPGWTAASPEMESKTVTNNRWTYAVFGCQRQQLSLLGIKPRTCPSEHHRVLRLDTFTVRPHLHPLYNAGGPLSYSRCLKRCLNLRLNLGGRGRPMQTTDWRPHRKVALRKRQSLLHLLLETLETATSSPQVVLSTRQ